MSTRSLPASHSLLFRIATAACPRRERAWLAALFAETSAIDSPSARVSWLAGAFALLLSANLRRTFDALARHPLIAVAIALLGASLFASPSLLGYEVLNLEDDWFLVAATVFGGALLGATAVSLLRDFDETRVLSGGRHQILP
jgi:hypothetical protein